MGDIIIQKDSKIKIYLSQGEDTAVRIAAKNLCSDIESVCGAYTELTCEKDEAGLIISSLSENKDAYKKLPQKNGSPYPESYSIFGSEGKLYIYGAERRGTVYGIYAFCEYIGVSPWYIFADVPAKKKDRIVIKQGYERNDHPTIPYRGIFINDEEELEAWAKLKMGEKTIGPKTYSLIFELLLRLGGNYIWPAMHVNAFNNDPENGRLANDMGLIVGTSHCDMLLRSNQNEWQPWCEKNGFENAIYDYSLGYENREIIKRYWRESVEQNNGYEVSYTVGMRGIHDTGFVTKAIDAEPVTAEEKRENKIKLLERVIDDQRSIIRSVTGKEDAPQTFIPYKEVLELYDNGLDLPDDITLIWTDDNFGYMRRYPNDAERARKGGNGLYYHVSYWAPPGMSYLFLGSIPLAHMQNELKKAYHNGIQKMWVLNVGAIKPLEQETEFFLRYAWDIEKNGTADDVTRFTEEWFNRNFSVDFGAEAADIYNTYAQITNVRKVEHMRSDIFSQTAFGNEAARRMNRYEDIYRRTAAIHTALPQNERDAFMQLFAMRIYAAYFINASFYYADRSVLMFDSGLMHQAEKCTELSKKADKYKRNIIFYYNKIMNGGKWDGILTPEEFPPPCTALYPACKPALVLDNNDDASGENDVIRRETNAHREHLSEVYYEDNGYVSIMAEHYTTNSGWREIPHAGRYEGSLMEAGSEGILEYEMIFCSDGEFILELYRFPSLDSVGRIRIGISIDDGEIMPMETVSNDEWRDSWKNNVLDNVEKMYLTLPEMRKGQHTLRVHAIDKYAAFSKIVIYTKGFISSNLGPAESFHPRFNPEPCYGGSMFEFDEMFAEKLFSELFNSAKAGLSGVIYAGKDFWSKDRLYLKNEVFYQERLGDPKYFCDESGNKNVFEKLYRGIFCEENDAIGIGAEHALLASETAFLVPDKNGIVWEHTQSETNGGTGLAMHIRQYGLSWNDASSAPSLNYRIRVKGGKYNI